MRVVQLIGPYAGQTLEMPFDVGMNCIASGTGCRPGDVHNHPVKGLSLDRFDHEALMGETAEADEEVKAQDAKEAKEVKKAKKAKAKFAKESRPGSKFKLRLSH